MDRRCGPGAADGDDREGDGLGMGDQFRFNPGVDINENLRKIGEGLALTIGVDPKKVKCKGIRIYFVDEENDILLQSGMFVSGFDINDWEGEED